MDVVVVGSCMIDYISYVPRLPKEGETIHSVRLETGFGGKGANQCVAASKLGAKSALIARLGDDTWGTQYTDHLKRMGVNVDNVFIARNTTSGLAQINVAANGANQIVIAAGANRQLSIADIEHCRELIANAKVLLCQLETPVDVALKAMEICKGKTILNGAPAIRDCNSKLLSVPSIFCVNETEAAVFADMGTINSVHDGRSACKKLVEKGCNDVILTMGAEGVLWASEAHPEPVYIRTPAVKCVDTTGAGDAFLGSLAFFIAQGRYSFKENIAAACIVASESVTQPGTQTSFPDKEILARITQRDIEQLLNC